jgi:hypothetical protein
MGEQVIREKEYTRVAYSTENAIVIYNLTSKQQICSVQTPEKLHVYQAIFLKNGTIAWGTANSLLFFNPITQEITSIPTQFAIYRMIELTYGTILLAIGMHGFSHGVKQYKDGVITDYSKVGNLSDNEVYFMRLESGNIVIAIGIHVQLFDETATELITRITSSDRGSTKPLVELRPNQLLVASGRVLVLIDFDNKTTQIWKDIEYSSSLSCCDLSNGYIAYQDDEGTINIIDRESNDILKIPNAGSEYENWIDQVKPNIVGVKDKYGRFVCYDTKTGHYTQVHDLHATSILCLL